MELLLNIRNFTQNCNWHKKLLDIPARDSTTFNFTPTKMKLGNGRGDPRNSILVIQTRYYKQAFSLSCTRQQYIYLFVEETLTDEKRLEVLEVDEKKALVLWEKYEYQFPRFFPFTMVFAAFSCTTGNWWRNPCIFHVMKFVNFFQVLFDEAKPCDATYCSVLEGRIKIFDETLTILSQ